TSTPAFAKANTGTISSAVGHLRSEGKAVSHIHLRYINPMAKNLGELLGRFDKVLVPELNMGQLTTIVRDRFMIAAEGLHKVTGKPFRISEIEDGIHVLELFHGPTLAFKDFAMQLIGQMFQAALGRKGERGGCDQQRQDFGKGHGVSDSDTS
ncbi:MAG: hypothetical protein COC10_10585, partial [Sphingobium sp.]